MFRVSQHSSSGVLKTVTAASGTGHNIGTATSFQRGQKYNEYRLFPGGKMRPGRAADHSPPSSAAVMEE